MRAEDPDRFVRRVTRRIAGLRRARGITQAQAADRLGVALKNWQRIEQGQNLTLHTLARVAAVLDCTPMDIVGTGALPDSEEE